MGRLNICFIEYKNKEHELYNNIREQMKNGEIRCPNCNSSMGMHGIYARKVIFLDTDIQSVNIIQGKCKNCKKVHAIIPSFIQPNKQYDADTIKNARIGKGLGICSADDSTIRRWHSKRKANINDEIKLK